MFVVRHVVRRPVAELAVRIARRPALAAFVALIAFAPEFACAPAFATAAAPEHSRQFTPHTPSTAVHTEFMVEINAKGQVTRVRSGKSCPDLAFNAMTYGNALQAFIRTPDGHAIPGTYRLSYDFNPKTKLVHRSVELVKAGGVDPFRISAVEEMAAIAKKNHGKEPAPGSSPTALPDFKAITGHRH